MHLFLGAVVTVETLFWKNTLDFAFSWGDG